MAVPNSNWNQISAITEKKFIPKLYDNIFRSIPLMNRLEKKKKLLDGGDKIMVPLNYAQNGAGGWYSGSETLSTTDKENITSAEFEWKQIYENISISRADELKNSGDAAKLNFVKSKVQIAEKTIRDRVGEGLWSAGTNSKSILGLRCFLSTSLTYGNISQTSYSWWQAQIDSSTTLLSIAAMQSLFENCSEDNDQPSVALTTKTLHSKYYSLLQPQQRFMDSETASAGFQNLLFNGKPVIYDSKCPSGYFVFLNENYLDLYLHKDENFRFEPFMKPINQNIKVAKIYSMMALASSNNRYHGAMTALVG